MDLTEHLQSEKDWSFPELAKAELLQWMLTIPAAGAVADMAEKEATEAVVMVLVAAAVTAVTGGTQYQLAVAVAVAATAAAADMVRLEAMQNQGPVAAAAVTVPVGAVVLAALLLAEEAAADTDLEVPHEFITVPRMAAMGQEVVGPQTGSIAKRELVGPESVLSSITSRRDKP